MKMSEKEKQRTLNSLADLQMRVEEGEILHLTLLFKRQEPNGEEGWGQQMFGTMDSLSVSYEVLGHLDMLKGDLRDLLKDKNLVPLKFRKGN